MNKLDVAKKMGIEKEADKIFTKLNPQYRLKDGTFPRAYGKDATPEYNRAYDKVYNQVKGVRTGKPTV